MGGRTGLNRFNDAENPIGMTVKCVETQIIQHKQQDQAGGGHGGGKADKVDQRVDPVPEDVSQGGFKVVGKHRDISKGVTHLKRLNPSLPRAAACSGRTSFSSSR